ANPVFVPTRESDGFRLTADMVSRSLTPKSKLLIVNSPNNPSGAVLDDEEFIKIARLCKERDVWIVSDECYDHFLYDGRKLFSIGSLAGTKSHVIIAGSVSKTYAMTGWRLGYVLGAKEVVAAV